MSWAERVALVVIGLGTLVSVSVFLLRALAARGRHSDKNVL